MLQHQCLPRSDVEIGIVDTITVKEATTIEGTKEREREICREDGRKMEMEERLIDRKRKESKQARIPEI
jgi:hypothetical protein